MKAKFIKEIVVTDPDTNLPVHIAVYKKEAGGIFAVDSSFLGNTEEPALSPFWNGILDLD